ncbi:hypothetical protein Ddye_026523 [Dipteronia dyeriana]|uniref:Uncharacterized protein n=1 Tax=Dipteronia dyeriana TaxID=168575 RepID=A0AAD9TMU7_9ROSI|nr:hypothetical protein Ddye_026523 [Dipteronia dyeriana]
MSHKTHAATINPCSAITVLVLHLVVVVDSLPPCQKSSSFVVELGGVLEQRKVEDKADEKLFLEELVGGVLEQMGKTKLKKNRVSAGYPIQYRGYPDPGTQPPRYLGFSAQVSQCTRPEQRNIVLDASIASIVIDLLLKDEKYRECLNWLPSFPTQESTGIDMVI